jgi:hypothetical protein
MTRSIAFFAFVALLTLPVARAEFVGGTYNPDMPSNVFTANKILEVNNPDPTYIGLAQEFTLQDDIFSLSELTLPLSLAAGADPSKFNFEIRSTFPGSGPEIPLFTGDFSSSSIGTTLAEVTVGVSPTGADGLAAGSYWFVLNADPVQNAGLTWGTVTGPSATTDISAYSTVPSIWSLDSGAPYGLALGGELTPAPEPGQIAMGAILFTCIGGVTLYQRKVKGKKSLA